MWVFSQAGVSIERSTSRDGKAMLKIRRAVPLAEAKTLSNGPSFSFLTLNYYLVILFPKKRL